MSDLQSLLKQYREACEVAAIAEERGYDLETREAHRDALFTQITSLFADSARVEREACLEIARKELLGLDCAQERVAKRIAKAIEGRGAEEGK